MRRTEYTPLELRKMLYTVVAYGFHPAKALPVSTELAQAGATCAFAAHGGGWHLCINDVKRPQKPRVRIRKRPEA